MKQHILDRDCIKQGLKAAPDIYRYIDVSYSGKDYIKEVMNKRKIIARCLRSYLPIRDVADIMGRSISNISYLVNGRYEEDYDFEKAVNSHIDNCLTH